MPQPKPHEELPDFAYELVRVPGASVVDECLEWKNAWRGSFTPIILGDGGDLDLITELWDEIADSPQDLVQKAAGLDLHSWFANRIEEPESLADFMDASAWNTRSSARNYFQSVRDILSQNLHPSVLVAKIPTPQPYEVPAYLKLGGWNACPRAEEHVAVWQNWQQKYGAEILCVTGAVIEATVANPPPDKESAYALAREQFAYCEDIVTQGVGSIDALAATLYRGKSWYFWWD